MILSPQVLLHRLRRRRTLVLGKSARLARTARVYNLGPSDDCITVGDGSIVRGELLRFAHGGKIVIGSMCYIGEGSRIWSGCAITLGDHVLVAHNVSIFDNLTHPLEWRERRRHFAAIARIGHPTHIDLGDRPVTIGDDAWIGANAIILRGITIGQRAIVAAGAVVTQDVAADTIVAGNPARPVRTLDAPQIEEK